MLAIDNSFDIYSLFKKPKAKFDFITIKFPSDNEQMKKLKALLKKTGDRCKFPKKRRNKIFTLHDPTKSELKEFVINFPDLVVEELEIAIDFYPKTESIGNKTQWALYEWLKKRLCPWQHKSLKNKCLRCKWSENHGKPIRDRTLGMKSCGSYYFNSKNKYQHVKLYVKERDQNKQVEEVFVRIELRLYRGGCQDFHVDRLALFPDFIERMRVDISAFFSVAVGIKYQKPRIRSKIKSDSDEQFDKELKKVERGWEKFGVSYAEKNNLKVKPDRKWKQMIGEALQVLRKRHQDIPHHMPEKVEHFKNFYAVRSLSDKGISLM